MRGPIQLSAFLARPVDVSALAGRVFYTAGGYKYAMAGEGACFLHCPPGRAPRPRDTGWFAAFGDLSGPQTGGVPFPRDGMRFMGATFDPSGLFRLVAALRWLEARGVSVAESANWLFFEWTGPAMRTPSR